MVGNDRENSVDLSVVKCSAVECSVVMYCRDTHLSGVLYLIIKRLQYFSKDVVIFHW